MSVWPTIERFIAQHGSAVLVTLADAQGSSPREPGARMVVRPDGGFSGSIGGGALEWAALAEAQSMLARGEDFRRFNKALGTIQRVLQLQAAQDQQQQIKVHAEQQDLP
jgi:xanthine dehydrogenase accessory factor